MDWHEKLRGFYAVLDRDDAKLAEVLLGAARVIQVRLKGAPARDLRRVAGWARELTRAHGALLVVNDDLEVALAVGADAVHLGQDDLPLDQAQAARAAAGRGPGAKLARLRIGVSTHTLEQVERAVRGGADYLGFGPVYPTSSKANPDPVVGPAGLARAVQAARPVPVVAIGGVTPARAGALAAAGAHAACAISAVNRASDVAAAAAAIAAAFVRAPRPG